MAHHVFRDQPSRRPPDHRQIELPAVRSEEHTSELQPLRHLVCRLLLEKKKEKSEQPRNRHVVTPRLEEITLPEAHNPPVRRRHAKAAVSGCTRVVVRSNEADNIPSTHL